MPCQCVCLHGLCILKINSDSNREFMQSPTMASKWNNIYPLICKSSEPNKQTQNTTMNFYHFKQTEILEQQCILCSRIKCNSRFNEIYRFIKMSKFEYFSVWFSWIWILKFFDTVWLVHYWLIFAVRKFHSYRSLIKWISVQFRNIDEIILLKMWIEISKLINSKSKSAFWEMRHIFSSWKRTEIWWRTIFHAFNLMTIGSLG